MFNNSNFKFNLNQNNFQNFYKKQEMENLEVNVNRIISDIIEINTDCIYSIIEDILSVSRGEILRKSWGKNNKKLLLYEINNNYKSIVDKIYVFPSKNSSDNISNLALNSERRSCLSLKSNKFESEPNILLEKFDFIEEEEKMRKFKDEFLSFKKMKEKVVKNFFKLSESQITGSAVRDWLYENSKY